MASIAKITGKNGDTYNVQVRIKGYPNKSKSFDDYETAFIWGKYQEMIIKEKDSFNIAPKDMYTVLDVMATKYGYESDEMRSCEDAFRLIDIWNTYLCHLDYDTLLNHAKTLLSTHVYRGGSKKNGSGIRKLPAPKTILRKFSYLATAINEMVKKGVNLDNHVLKVVAYIRELEKENKDESEKM